MDEPDSKQTRTAVIDLLEKGYSLYTIDIALAECLNAIWKHTNLLKDLDSKKAKFAAEDLVKLYDELTIIPTRELQEKSLDIALSLNITIYDALYIAAAQKMKATLFTADQKLCTEANKAVKLKILTRKE